MASRIRMLALTLALAGAAHAAPPSIEQVQGLYEGTAGGRKAEARVVALGKGAFKVLVRVAGDGGTVEKAELEGTLQGDALAFAGKENDWKGAWSDRSIRGTCGSGALALKRVVRESPTLGARPPAGAIVLLPLQGGPGDEIVKKPGKDGAEQQWKIFEDGGVLVPKGGFTSKRSFDCNFKLHVEFKNPLMPEARGQGRGNSGVFFPNGQEIQVLDSFGMETYTGGGCGGLYKYKDPDTFDGFNLSSLPPGQWQTYDIEVTEQDGKAILTALHNGVRIHDKHAMTRPPKKGVFSFQDHNDPVQYRNIWVLPLP